MDLLLPAGLENAFQTDSCSFSESYEPLLFVQEFDSCCCRLSLMPTPDCRLSLMPTTDVGSLVPDDDDV